MQGIYPCRDFQDQSGEVYKELHGTVVWIIHRDPPLNMRLCEFKVFSYANVAVWGEADAMTPTWFTSYPYKASSDLIGFPTGDNHCSITNHQELVE